MQSRLTCRSGMAAAPKALSAYFRPGPRLLTRSFRSQAYTQVDVPEFQSSVTLMSCLPIMSVMPLLLASQAFAEVVEPMAYNSTEEYQRSDLGITILFSSFVLVLTVVTAGVSTLPRIAISI
jgi:hypothetical protein